MYIINRIKNWNNTDIHYAKLTDQRLCSEIDISFETNHKMGFCRQIPRKLQWWMWSLFNGIGKFWPPFGEPRQECCNATFKIIQNMLWYLPWDSCAEGWETQTQISITSPDSKHTATYLPMEIQNNWFKRILVMTAEFHLDPQSVW